MSEIIHIRLKKNQAFNILGHQICFFGYTSLRVLMITWHLWAAVSCGQACKQ